MSATATTARTKVDPAVDRPAGRLRVHAWFTPYLFLLPYLALLTTFVLVPAVFGIWVSLHDWDFMLPNKPFIGLQNYVDLFTPDSVTFPEFWNGMKATAIFTVASVPFLVLIPLGIALMLNRVFPARSLLRAMIFAPFVLGIAVVGVLFRYLLDSQFGLINWFLGLFGIPPVGWTQTQPWAWVALVGMTVWWTLGFNAVIYLAGLQGIPRDQYEAAAIDGAGSFARFINVTLPGLRNILVFIITTTVLASANMFGQAYLVTNGGPGDSTRTAIMVMTQEGLRAFKMGSATAMSYLLAICLAVVSVINFMVLREREGGK
ncbi:sugar ABC transporter permease [Microlunatus elymi]|uniref:Sugar ABC transporter permease n=1 Tax=Microlunatus elymi TaxID=2596828 RepID=A0A516Q0I1_9ACTN|nr:sugar ABC transporter permease [Microlunatus elymi]QDP96930.1 sugar ABC transporter permease [Microlunatus elymi]